MLYFPKEFVPQELPLPRIFISHHVLVHTPKVSTTREESHIFQRGTFLVVQN